MRNFLFCFVLLLLANNLFAQKYDTIPVKIEWEGIKKNKLNDSQYQSFINFKGCVINNIYQKVPIFIHKINFEKDDIIKDIVLKDCIYDDLSAEEDSLLKVDKTTIADNIAITSSQSNDNFKNTVSVSFLPIHKNPITNNIEKLISFKIQYVKEKSETQTKKNKSFAQHSVLSTGEWYKIAVNNTGMHKITYNDLVSLGINPTNIKSHNISLYGNGSGMLPELNSDFRYDDLQEIAIEMHDGNDNSFDPNDYFLFYGQSQVSWKYNSASQLFEHRLNLYSDYTYYYIVVDSTIGVKKRIENENSLSSTTQDNIITKFNDYAEHEMDLYNIVKSGQTWVGERFDNTLSNYNFSFNFNDIDPTSNIHVKTNLVAASTSPSHFNISVNGNSVDNVSLGAISGSFEDTEAYSVLSNVSLLSSNSIINTNITYNVPLSTSVGWLDYIEINAKRNLRYSGTQMSFRSIESVGIGKLSQFVISNSNTSVKVWDVTDPTNSRLVKDTLIGANISFTLNTDTLREFIAFNGSAFYSPILIGSVNNQDLHNLTQQDMVIVTYPDFISEANRLANLHRNNDSLRVIVVTPSQIYNEFSSGSQDPIAIRMFMKMFYDRATTQNDLPKYLLLLGRASYDFKNRLPNNSNYVTTYESQDSYNPTTSYVTDDFFGFLGDNETGSSNLDDLDIGIGRFPVSTLGQAKAVVDKVIRYTKRRDLLLDNPSNTANVISNLADWRNTICFVADDEEGNSFVANSEALALKIKNNDPVYNVDKIYLDAYPQLSTPGGQRYPDVNVAIDERVEKGALIINYIGHGGELGWAHERVLEISDIDGWKNFYNMPVFVTATCEFSRFDDPSRNAAGELVLLNANGGGAALFTTSRLSFSSTNQGLNDSFFNRALLKTNGKYPRLGDILRLSKNDNGNNTMIKNFVLLGDPAMKLAYPEYNVSTTQINSKLVDSSSDTISSLSNITIKGIITDDNLNKITSYNGIIYPVVYDKPMTVTTLANDPASSAQNFILQKNILYKGKASVVNGDFTFSFVVPKDIAYQYGFGKISYYSQNGVTDANGYYNNIVIGGTDTSVVVDENGPTIRLFMNDTNFIYGGTTNENPILLAFLNDLNGINTVGNGIGHNLVAVLDNDNENPIILNDYYSSELDNYKKGTISYPFFNLSNGVHTLKLKVWDTFNNSAEATTEFIVSESAQLVLNNLLNYPNPFYDNTYFVFEHNQPETELNVQIQIYDIKGKLVKLIQKNINNQGFKIDPIEWNGTTDSGEKIGKGLYIYRLILKKADGSTIEKTNKLVFLR